MADVNEMLREQQEELERIRARRGNKRFPVARVRWVLNVVFLVLGVTGFGLYFTESYGEMGFALMLLAILVKIAEFVIRFLY